jgi:VWFA-related protein
MLLYQGACRAEEPSDAHRAGKYSTVTVSSQSWGSSLDSADDLTRFLGYTFASKVADLSQRKAGFDMWWKFTGFSLALIATSVCAQMPGGQTMARPMNNFDVILQQGGPMDFNTMQELDHKRHDQLGTKSEATVSLLDLKAPARARSEYNKGLQFISQNNYEKAIESLLKAVTLYPQFVSAHNALGFAYFSQKQLDLARQEFSRAVKLDDHLSGSYLNLGRTQLSLGDTSGAQSAFEKASSIAPLDANLITTLAYVQFLNHDYAGAIHTAVKAHARSHPGSALVHYFSAAAWRAQNNLDEMQRELQTFLTEDPKSTYAQQARQFLAEVASRQTTTSSAPDPPAVSFDTANSGPRSQRGEQVLQDFREKQQIAEVEKSGPECSACTTPEARAGSPLSGSTTNDSRRHDNYGWTLHSTVEEVAVFFTATDHGKSVTDLTLADIAIQDDKKPPAAILGLRNEAGLPLRLGLLIDTSVSITDRFSFEQKAASKFLGQVLTGPEDLAFVAGFSNSVVLVQDFTQDIDKISRGLDELAPVGGTALWDAISFASDKLLERPETKPVVRVLVVISDGDDNSSQATLKQAIERAERNEVVVYTVSTRDIDPGSDEEFPGNHAMKILAEYTGGAAFFPGSADRLNHGLAELQQEIRSRYLVSYKPAQFIHDGHYRTISIHAQKSGHKLKVDSRRGYYANASHADPEQLHDVWARR